MVKVLSKLVIERYFLSFIKNMYKNLQLTSYLMVKDSAFFLKLGTEHGCLLSPLLCNIVLEVQATARRQRKEIKDIKFGKEK